MSNSIDLNTVLQAPNIAAFKGNSRTSQQAGDAEPMPTSSPTSSKDYTTISDESLRRFHADTSNARMIAASYEGREEEESEGSTWQLSSGLKEGTFTLKNGNKQTVSIEGNSLEIEEFKDGKLVKTVKGNISDKGASLDTEYYDSSGKVSQSIHTEIFEGESKNGWSLSTMSRNIKWFDNGNLKGELQDNMLLNSWDSTKGSEDAEAKVLSLLSKGTAKLDTDVEDLSKLLTSEKHISSYFANLNEYGENGKLARNIVVEQEGRYKQNSNRANEKLGGMEKRSTEEAFHDIKLSMQIRDYDSEGNLVRDARFSDNQADHNGTSHKDNQQQTVDVSWFNKGEMVKRSHGDMNMSETAMANMPDRPGFLESFGLSVEQYLGNEPQSAMGLMKANLMEVSGEPSFFADALGEHMAEGDYSTAEGVGRYGGLNQPYSISWTDEIFRDGELLMRQKDTEEAQKTSFYQHERGMLFRKGGALTENDSPVVLRKTSHEVEKFDGDEMVAHGVMTAKESVDIDMDGPDKLVTNALVSQGVGRDEVTTALNNTGPLSEVDENPNSAAKGFANEMEQTLDTFYEAFRDMNEEEVDPATAFRVHLNYVEKFKSS